MNRRLFALNSPWLTGALLVVLMLCVFFERKIMADWRAFLAGAEKSLRGRNQATALANAIEQYGVDFPDSGLFTNDGEWVERLGGNNPKKIRYLKPEMYSRDSSGRLLDPCGAPWIIDVPGSPEVEARGPGRPADEFHVRSGICPGFAFGHQKNPRFERAL